MLKNSSSQLFTLSQVTKQLIGTLYAFERRERQARETNNPQKPGQKIKVPAKHPLKTEEGAGFMVKYHFGLAQMNAVKLTSAELHLLKEHVDDQCRKFHEKKCRKKKTEVVMPRREDGTEDLRKGVPNYLLGEWYNGWCHGEHTGAPRFYLKPQHRTVPAFTDAVSERNLGCGQALARDPAGNPQQVVQFPDTPTGNPAIYADANDRAIPMTGFAAPEFMVMKCPISGAPLPRLVGSYAGPASTQYNRRPSVPAFCAGRRSTRGASISPTNSTARCERPPRSLSPSTGSPGGSRKGLMDFAKIMRVPEWIGPPSCVGISA